MKKNSCIIGVWILCGVRLTLHSRHWMHFKIDVSMIMAPMILSVTFGELILLLAILKEKYHYL
jgi:hypothetical protein